MIVIEKKVYDILNREYFSVYFPRPLSYYDYKSDSIGIKIVELLDIAEIWYESMGGPNEKIHNFCDYNNDGKMVEILTASWSRYFSSGSHVNLIIKSYKIQLQDWEIKIK